MAEIHAKKIDERKFSSLLQKDMIIRGELHFPESVLIKGKVEGLLESEAEVVIDKKAEIRGNIHAVCSQIQGTTIGDIHCTQEVKISQSARVNGDISTPSLHIENGSFFEGRSIMNHSQQNVPKLPGS